MDPPPSSHPRGVIHIERPTYTQAQFEASHPRVPQTSPSWNAKLKTRCACSKTCARTTLAEKIPIARTLRRYAIRRWMLNDLVAGISVGVIHIPQCLGFAILAGVPPQYGLYTSLFPSLVYFVFGTAHHISLGTMAIMSLLTGAVVERELPGLLPSLPPGINASNTSLTGPGEEGLRVSLATSLCLLMGGWQVGLSSVKLGMVAASSMSVTFIGGFMAGCAGHIIVSQTPTLLGISIERPSGNFSLLYALYRTLLKLPEVNAAAILTSLVCMAFLFVVKEIVNVRFRSKLKAPIPAELILIILITLVSYLADFDSRFGVKVIGVVPNGFPVPAVPGFEHAGNYVMDSFLLAVVSFAISISMAKMIGRKNGYAVDENQELFALGLSFFLSSFFGAFPGSQAPPRSLVQDSAGGKTQVASLFSCCLVLLVTLVAGPAVKPLPMCAVASIIVIALVPLLKSFSELPRLWRVNRLDLAIWLITWLVTLIVSITVGLLVGVGFSLLTVVLSAVVGGAEKMVGIEAGLYKERGYEVKRKEDEHIVVVRAQGPLFFANIERFKASVLKASGFGGNSLPVTENGDDNNNEKDTVVKSNREEIDTCEINSDITLQESSSHDAFSIEAEHPRVLVLDASAVSYIDVQGLTGLAGLRGELEERGVRLVLASCPEALLRKLGASGAGAGLGEENVYVTVQDAVEALRHVDTGSGVDETGSEAVETGNDVVEARNLEETVSEV